MSSKKKRILLVKKSSGEKTWHEYDDPDSAFGDIDIIRRQGHEVIAETDVEIKDQFKAFKLSDPTDWSDKNAKRTVERFAEIYDDIVPGKYHEVGRVADYEFERADLVRLRDWLNGAIEFCGEGPK